MLGLFLYFYHMGFRNQTWVVSLVCKHFYLLNHLEPISPHPTVTKILKYIVLFLCSWLIQIFPACHHQTFPNINEVFFSLDNLFLCIFSPVKSNDFLHLNSVCFFFHGSFFFSITGSSVSLHTFMNINCFLLFMSSFYSLLFCKPKSAAI